MQGKLKSRELPLQQCGQGRPFWKLTCGHDEGRCKDLRKVFLAEGTAYAKAQR